MRDYSVNNRYLALNLFISGTRSWHSIYIHLDIHTCIYTHTCIHTYIKRHTYVYIHTYTYIHTYIHTFMHTCTYIHTCIHTCTYKNTYIHKYIHTYIFILYMDNCTVQPIHPSSPRIICFCLNVFACKLEHVFSCETGGGEGVSFRL